MVELHGFQLCKPLSIIERISFNAFFGCNGKSGVSTTAVPLKRLFQGSRHRTAARSKESV